MAESNDSNQQHIGVVTGGSDVRQRPPAVKTKDEAKRFLDEALVKLKQRRADCDIIVPNNTQATANLQQRNFRKLLLHVGAMMGSSSAFYSAGLLDEIAYDHFHHEALKQLAGKTVGFAGGNGLRGT